MRMLLVRTSLTYAVAVIAAVASVAWLVIFIVWRRQRHHDAASLRSNGRGESQIVTSNPAYETPRTLDTRRLGFSGVTLDDANYVSTT